MSRENVDSCAMSIRVPFLRAAAFFLAALTASLAYAQDVVSEVKALRQSVEIQAKQIEVLSAQIARLAERLDGHATTVTERVAPSPADSTEFAIPAARAVPPHPPANVHIVVKGESLEKIAKSLGITTAELQKINHITDPKKLQIGQQLLLPPPTPKKEAQ